MVCKFMTQNPYTHKTKSKAMCMFNCFTCSIRSIFIEIKNKVSPATGPFTLILQTEPCIYTTYRIIPHITYPYCIYPISYTVYLHVQEHFQYYLTVLLGNANTTSCTYG